MAFAIHFDLQWCSRDAHGRSDHHVAEREDLRVIDAGDSITRFDSRRHPVDERHRGGRGRSGLNLSDHG